MQHMNNYSSYIFNCTIMALSPFATLVISPVF